MADDAAEYLFMKRCDYFFDVLLRLAAYAAYLLADAAATLLLLMPPKMPML